MNESRLFSIIVGPHVSEKSTRVSEQHRQMVFKVLPSATKAEVKTAVEKLFNVVVEQVTLTNMPGKERRRGQVTGRRSDWKKAYVSLKEGHDIQFVTA